MTPQKKLIEVALPLDAINRGCEEDKNRKTGHIRNLHKWFAPMPLPSWRAMLFAALVDDPADCRADAESLEERARLLGLVERLAAFESHEDTRLIEEARAELRKAFGTDLPVVVDPFCGGGSTILEAQRLGLAARGSDLNPLPILITTALCRVPSLFAAVAPVGSEKRRLAGDPWPGCEALVNDVLHYAGRVRERVAVDLERVYPKVAGVVPHAYRWCWTVASPDPAARGARTPLVSSWVLSKQRGAVVWIEPVVGVDGRVSYRVRAEGKPLDGTTSRSGATDLFSKVQIPLDYIRAEGRAGRLMPQLMAIIGRKDGRTVFVAPDEEQELAASVNSVPDLPGIPMPTAALGFRVQPYGINDFHDLFTPRQQLALATFARGVDDVRTEIELDARKAGLRSDGIHLEDGGQGATAYADAIATVLGLAVGKMAQSNNILVRWFVDPRNGSGKGTPAFDRHALPMVWDFVETNPLGGSVGDWMGPVLETAVRAFALTVPESKPAIVVQQDARLVASELPAGALIATDPPYYANIGYADLSDFFYLWLRPALKRSYPKLLSVIAAPKAAELIATPFRHGGDTDRANAYFRAGFSAVFGSLAERADPRFPMLIVYAMKQAEESEGGASATGWEVFLGGLVDAGLSITATWPVRTTTVTRMIGIGTNALASAIFVISRRRPPDARTASRREFVTALANQLPRALRDLQSSNIPPVDLAQAAIGPGMAIFSGYASVVDAAGVALTVGDALALINQALDHALSEQEGDYDADSRWALAWLEQSGFAEGEFGVADVLARAKNTSVQGLVEAGVLASSRGKVRLFRPDELPADWDPARDTRLTAWEMVHQLIRVLASEGEPAAAALVAKLGAKAEVARELCYRLYTICERKKRAADALSYNALVQSWPELLRLAREGAKPRPAQAGLFGDSEA